MSEFTLEEIGKWIGAEVIGDASHRVSGASSIENARGDQITFLANPRYRPLLKQSQAGAIILSKDDVADKGQNYLVVSNPTSAFQIVIEAFYKTKSSLNLPASIPRRSLILQPY